MTTAPPTSRTFNIQEWISKSEAAKLRGISRQAIWELVRRGRLTTFEFGHRVFLNRSEVMNFQRRPRGPASDYHPQKRRKKNNIDPAKWVSKSEGGKLLGITRQAISDLIKRRRLRTMIAENKTYVSRSGIERFKALQKESGVKHSYKKKKKVDSG